MAFNFYQNLVLCVQLLLALLSSTVRHSAAEFEVYLEVTDDEERVDVWTYKSEQLEIDRVHEKATELMKRALRRRQFGARPNNATSVGDREEEEPDVTPVRRKRDVREDTSEECRDKGNYMSVITGVVSEVGKTVKMACNFCGSSSRSALNARVWYRFNREDMGGDAIFNAEAVKLDKHDDAKLNRIYTQPDHTLVIDRFEPNDIGAYFCESYNAKTLTRTRPFSFKIPNVAETSPAAVLLGWKAVIGSKGVTFMTILDFMPRVSYDQVSYTISGYPKPTVPRKNTKSNWISYTQWGDWAACSKCGNDGVKKRIGKCLVRKIDDNVPARPEYLDEVLKLHPRGAPCQSSLFTDRTLVEAIRNEIELDQCSLPCGADATQFLGVRLAKQSIGQVENVFRKALQSGGIPTVPPLTQMGIEQEEGTTLKLFCPSIYEDSDVVWKKNGVIMKPAEMILNTSGRVRLDQFLRMSFKTLELDDTGHYSCFVDFRVTVDYFVAVYPLFTDHGPWMPGILIIAGWYGGAFFVFLFTTLIIHAQRFDNSRARAYRTKRAIRMAKGYRDYKDVYGVHGQKKGKSSLRGNATRNANTSNNWSYDDDVMANLFLAEANKNLNSTNNYKFAADESILTAGTSTLSTESTDKTSFTTSTSTTSESEDESDLESVNLSSSGDEYSVLDSCSDWEFSSHYSATGYDTDIPDEPHWMIF